MPIRANFPCRLLPGGGFVFLKMKYSEKLRSPRWQKRRLEILERDKFTCTLCNDDKTELHVHHKKYSGEPWEAPESDLQTVCKYCHAALTYYKNKYGKEISIINKRSDSVKCFNPENIIVTFWCEVSDFNYEYLSFVFDDFDNITLYKTPHNIGQSIREIHCKQQIEWDRIDKIISEMPIEELLKYEF